jgi:hypothetical protein
MFTHLVFISLSWAAVASLRAPTMARLDRRANNIVGLATGVSSSLVCLSPSVAKASVDAAEALQLLDGYETHIPFSVTWGVLIAGGTYLLFEFYKMMASL